MNIYTSRFGQVNIAEDRVLTFPRGLYGFPGQNNYVLLQAGDEVSFFWLQSTQNPETAFLVTDPIHFDDEYTVRPRKQDLATIAEERVEDIQLFCICNRVGRELVANFQGPLLVGSNTKKGVQVAIPGQDDQDIRRKLMVL